MPTNPPVMRRGFMLLLSAPSGAGKTTLSRRLIAEDAALRFSVSLTTRPARSGEVEGIDYYFTSPEDFARRAAAGELLEQTEIFGHHYATPLSSVEPHLAEGRDVLFEIDWSGFQQLLQKRASDVVSVFILPPSLEELARRLTSRQQDSASVVAERLQHAAEEIRHWRDYDYVLTNHRLEEALSDLKAIVTAERLKRARQSGLDHVVHTLLAPAAHSAQS